MDALILEFEGEIQGYQEKTLTVKQMKEIAYS